MAITMDHVSLTVSDVDRSADFYVKAFGMTKTRRYAVEGPEVSAVVGYPDASLEIAWLALGAMNVELIQYVSPKATPHTRLETKDVGTPHLAFHTDDIDRDFKRLVEMGATFRNPPAEPIKLRSCYGWDPDGITFELVQRDKRA